MNRHSLYIALALAAPVLFAVGCGSHETRSVAEQEMQPTTAPTMEQKAPVNEMPEQDVVEAVFAQIEAQPEANTDMAEAELQPVIPPETAPVMNQPDDRVFYFATGDSDVKQEDFEKIIGHAQYLMQNPDKVIRISGHTDQSGPVEYNRWLSKRRAQSVAGILTEYGVNPSQIVVESMGADKPVLGLEHAIADRRVELDYMDDTRLSEANSF